MIKYKYMLLLTIVVGILMSSCSKERADLKTSDSGDDAPKIEGVITGGLWILENSDMPSASMKDSYDKIQIKVEDNLNYSWIWEQKNGQDFEMTGYIYEEKSSHIHETGSGIWNVYFYVTHINGQALPGGFYGIYAFEDENHLILNVEPDVQNWGKHPTAEEGIGSGAKGGESVYVMTKQ
jgi:hypothetical protein